MQEWQTIPKNDDSRMENLQTQPRRNYRVFNNPAVITEAWYPVTPARKFFKKNSHSFKIGAQRFVLFRGEDGLVRALDAFCPHMGADLSRGSVEGNSLRCYFHRWKFDAEGTLREIPCKTSLPFQLKIKNYPVEEKYGYLWVYSGESAPHPVPEPVGLEDFEVEGSFIFKTELFVHHHVLMASAIDLQHFASVHGLDAQYNLEVQDTGTGVIRWSVRGLLAVEGGWRTRIARAVLGASFQYDALFAGGSLIAMTYGLGQTWRGKKGGKSLPVFYALWGCVPLANGLSEAVVFVLQKKRRGPFSRVTSKFFFWMTLGLLAWLKDDDVQAFPRMRFQAKNLIDQDASVAQLIRWTETLPRSAWSFEN